MRLGDALGFIAGVRRETLRAVHTTTRSDPLARRVSSRGSALHSQRKTTRVAGSRKAPG